MREDALFDAGLDDVGHMLGRLGEEVGEVRAEPALDEADQEQVGEAAGQHAVQGVGPLGPAFRESDAADTLGVKAEPVVQVRGHLEAGRVDEQVDRVLDTVHHGSARR